MADADVVIVGAGPAGLMLAGELALAGVTVALLERRDSQALAGSRAGGLHARSLEVLDQRGIVGRFLAVGQVGQVAGFAFNRLDISDLPTRHPYGLGLWQNHIERLLAEWVRERGVTIRYGTDVTGFTEDAAGVDVTLAGGGAVRARYLVGCDGGRSLVRKQAGIDFPGWEATSSNLLAQVQMRQTPPFGVHQTALGLHSFGRLDYTLRDGQIVYADQGPIGVMVAEAEVGTGDPTLDDLRAALIRVCGTDYGVHDPIWLTRFTDAARQAAAYRKGRVLLAGDAAHVHGPQGGQGLNTGLQDAVNLGWKLALVVQGKAPDSLLDSYHAERHPVAARVVQAVMAQQALLRPDDRSAALREVVARLLATDSARQLLAAQMSGLDIAYDLGAGHPLLGRRMPDLDLATDTGPQRVSALLHGARPVLVNFGLPGIDIAPWLDRVRHLSARTAGPWRLPVLGEVPAPGAVLIRPDGHVAWVGSDSADGLTRALTTWFGRPA